jgi:acyl-CoA hydrolase
MIATYGMGYRASSEYKLAIATSDVKVKKPLRSGKVVEVYQDVVWVWQRNCERIDVAEINQHMLWLEAEKRVLRTIAA